MGMYDDIVDGVSANFIINGHQFYAENINGDEPFNRREVSFKPILNGTLVAKKGKYIQRKLSFTTTLYHPTGRPDTHEKILKEIVSKPVEVMSPYIGTDSIMAVVVFSPNVDEASPNHMTYDVDITEIPDVSLISGEGKLQVPAVKVITTSQGSSTKIKQNRKILKKCKVPIKKNSKGDCVKAIQYLLNVYGYLSKKNMSGKYDNNTIKAVKQLQKSFKKNGLKVSGTVDKKTRDTLLKL